MTKNIIFCPRCKKWNTTIIVAETGTMYYEYDLETKEYEHDEFENKGITDMYLCYYCRYEFPEIQNKKLRTLIKEP